MRPTIMHKLEELAQCDTEHDVFGSWKHLYEQKPLPRDVIETFESDHDVSLPAPYRDWLITIGVGAGPSYGLLAPTHLYRRDEHSERRSETGAPFPLHEAWCNLDEPSWPHDSNRYDGCIRLVELGCGYFDVIIAAGPRRGEVWTDWTAVRGAGKMEPKAPGFLQWYDGWLDRALREWAVAEVKRAVRRDPLVASPRVLELTAHLDVDTPKFSDTLARGYRQLLLGNVDDAKATFELAHTRHPAFGSPIESYWLALSDLYWVTGDEDARLDAVSRGSAFRSRRQAAFLREKEAILRGRGDVAGALETLKARVIARGQPTHDRIVVMGECARQLRDHGRIAELDPIVDQIVERRMLFGKQPEQERRAAVRASIDEALAVK